MAVDRRKTGLGIGKGSMRVWLKGLEELVAQSGWDPSVWINQYAIPGSSDVSESQLNELKQLGSLVGL